MDGCDCVTLGLGFSSCAYVVVDSSNMPCPRPIRHLVESDVFVKSSQYIHMIIGVLFSRFIMICQKDGITRAAC